MITIGDLRLPFHPEELPAPARLQTESQADLATLVQTYSPLLFRVAYSIVRTSAEAEDIVQEVFLRVLQHRAKAKPAAVLDTRVWLVRIAWNLALDRRRRKRPDQMGPAFAAALMAPNQPADQALAQSQRMQLVLAQLEKLPAPERHALLLTAVEELSTPEVAAILDRSESAVRALLSRARQRLRERLAANEKP